MTEQVCPACATPVRIAAATWCGNCGSPLNNASAPAPAPVQQSTEMTVMKPRAPLSNPPAAESSGEIPPVSQHVAWEALPAPTPASAYPSAQPPLAQPMPAPVSWTPPTAEPGSSGLQRAGLIAVGVGGAVSLLEPLWLLKFAVQWGGSYLTLPFRDVRGLLSLVLAIVSVALGVVAASSLAGRTTARFRPDVIAALAGGLGLLTLLQVIVIPWNLAPSWFRVLAALALLAGAGLLAATPRRLAGIGVRRAADGAAPPQVPQSPASLPVPPVPAPYSQPGFLQAGQPDHPFVANAGHLPSTLPTILVSLFFGLIGAIVAHMHTQTARRMGVETNRYWKACIFSVIASIAVWFGITLLLFILPFAILANSGY